MREPIYLCDLVVYHRKYDREYTIKDLLLVGNDLKLIESNEYFYKKICKTLPLTPRKLEITLEQKLITIRKIDFKKQIGETMENAGWSTTKTT